MIELPCLALWQPWASLVLYGFKLIETRPQYHSVRGNVGIHITKDNFKFREQNEAFFYSQPCYSRLSTVGFRKFQDLPRGGVGGYVNVTSWKKIVLSNPREPIEMVKPASTVEQAFGDYRPGRWGVHYSAIYRFTHLFSASGKQQMIFPVQIPNAWFENLITVPIPSKTV